jgi:hypothetical protein
MFGRILIPVLILLTSLNAICQKENNNWYFGNGAGISFNNSTPTIITSSHLYTDEGSSSVCDTLGNLLFYTDGVTVWNKKNEVIGSDLLGHKSSTQSANIVPHPSKNNLYYIFTTTEKGGIQGLRYSIVDVSGNNFKGKIIEKNVLVLTPVAEKLTIAKHKNTTDFWIITHKWNSNQFCSFHLSENGLAKAPVISTLGTIHKDVGSGNKGEAIGQMKVSSNQKKLAVAITYKPNQPIEIFDFDNNTGKISNIREIATSGFAYGLEFSPDNSKLYASFLKGNYGVIQYDLLEDNIFDRGTTILSAPKGYENFGSLQLGPDNKIYVAKTGRYVDVINLPNKKGKACSYKLGGINLRDKSCVYGLPPKVYSRNLIAKSNKPIKEVEPAVATKIITKTKSLDSKLCTKDVTLDAGKAYMVYLWSTNEKTKTIVVTEPGIYNVVISHPSNISSETQSFNVSSGEPKVNLGADIKVKCESLVDIDAKNKGFEYKWSNGSKGQILTVRESGTYSVTITNGTCWDRDTIMVELADVPPIFKALTSFSPQNTSFNSFFDYSIQGINEFELIVKSPRGKTVFKTNNPEEKWSGINDKRQLFDPGDYTWIAKYKGPCTNGYTITKDGVVNLY